MTAELALVGDLLPAATPRTVAEERAQRIRSLFGAALGYANLALEELAAAREARDDVTLGFPTWHEFVAWLIGGDLRNLRLHNQPQALAERKALAQSMREAGMTYRPIADALGVSLGSVRNDLGVARPKVEPVAPLPAPTGPVWAQALEWLRRHPEGLTYVELARVAGWTEGKASGALAYLGPATAKHPQRKGLAVRTEQWRGGIRVHIAGWQDGAR